MSSHNLTLLTGASVDEWLTSVAFSHLVLMPKVMGLIPVHMGLTKVCPNVTLAV